MTVYVDFVQRWPSGLWCHMMTDGDLEELHRMADKIGLSRRYFQNKPGHPHYDLRPSKRSQVVLHGAREVSSAEMLRRCSAGLRKLVQLEQENFFDAVRADPDMTPEQKAKWLACEPPAPPP